MPRPPPARLDGHAVGAQQQRMPEARPPQPPPILAGKEYAQPSVFEPENLLREARRQKRLPSGDIPAICVLDPDGDILRSLIRTKRAERSPVWACYHTDLYVFEQGGLRFGIIGCAVGASFAV